MKNLKLRGERWLREAQNTLRQAEHNCVDGAYNVACFLAEQAGQKALKAVLYYRGTRYVTIHSLQELIRLAGKVDNSFLRFLEAAGKLDQYYLSSRYPDALAEPAIPSEVFVNEQAKEAIAIGKEIIGLCATTIHGGA